MIKRLSGLVILVTVTAMMTSCAIYRANYSVSLKAVECPANAKQQFGETKVVNFQDKDGNKYRYEDDYINIVWFVSPQRFNFTLTNKSGHTLKINWDDLCYVDYQGGAKRVMHAGVKYNERNNSQPPSTIPNGTSLSDMLLPTDNVRFVNGGWSEDFLIPCIYKNSVSREKGAPYFVGKTMTIMMPIMIENIQNDYTFTFCIDKLL